MKQNRNSLDRMAGGLLVLLCLLALGEGLRAQGTDFRHSVGVGPVVATHGLGLQLHRVRQRSYTQGMVYAIEVAHIKDGREQRQINNLSGISSQLEPKSFRFGKQHNFLALRVALGQQFLIADKASEHGISVHIRYALGGVLGILKPYYLNVVYATPDGSPTQFEVIQERYDADNPGAFENPESVLSAVGFLKGIDQVKPVPGAHLRGSLLFDWAAVPRAVRSLEAGFGLDVFLTKIPIMVAEPQHRFHFRLFLAVNFGRRW